MKYLILSRKHIDVIVTKKKKEIDNGVVYFEAEKDIESVAYERWIQAEQMYQSYEELYYALDILKKIDPAGHKLIMEFYFCGEKITYTELAKRYGVSRWACSKKIHKCLKRLRTLMEMHNSQY